MKESKKGFFGEFYNSWGWRVCKWTLVIVFLLLVLLYSSSLIFDDSSMYFLKNKHDYTFKIVEIAVSIFAFVGLIWSITYQREELLQSRKELQQSRSDLKLQSENINRSIDETNKNFDRELLLEFYREIASELNRIDLPVSSFLVESRYRIHQTKDKRIVEEIQDCVGKIGFMRPELQRLLSQIESKALSVGADDSDLRDLYKYAYGDAHIKSAIDTLGEDLAKVESGVLILLYDMIFYAKNKGISLKEPVFSLLRAALKRSNFFIDSKSQEYRLSGERFTEVCIDVGVIEIVFNKDGLPCDRSFDDKKIDCFISSLHSLGVIGNKEDFTEMLDYAIH